MGVFYAQNPPQASIIMRMERRAARRTQAKACATLILLAWCRCATALNPSLDINQYAHTPWTIREGFFKGAISSFAQTPDGYLWLGTEFGLLHFDGVRSVPGSRRRVSVSPAALFEACSPHAMGVFGLVPLKGLQGGRTAS